MTTTAAVKTHVGCAPRGYYDPTTAQFLTPDPLFALTGERYGYAGNDPINGTDPTGLICFSFSCAKNDIKAATHTVSNDVVKPVIRSRGTILTRVAIGVCIGATGGACVAFTGTALAVRAEQRFQEKGWKGSWKANLLDLGVTGATLGVGTYLEGLEGFPADGTLARRLYEAMYAFPDIASFLEGRLTGEDAIESLAGYGDSLSGETGCP